VEGDNLILSLGLSHPIKFTPPKEIKISIEKNTIKISGVDKALVSQVAAQIRAFKKPEPYKGKGIKYQGEVIRRKAGKKVAGTTT
jgi:large subunit ribosomal protein L6